MSILKIVSLFMLKSEEVLIKLTTKQMPC